MTAVDVVWQFRRGLPDHVWTSVHNTQRAAALIVKAVDRGWTVPDLIAECADLASVANCGGALLHRLDNCAELDKRRRAVPDWCGCRDVCDRTTRHLLDENRLPGPARCPDCHWLSPRKPQ